ncbi:MAG: hypothetical protein R3F43_08365 [bacterium]
MRTASRLAARASRTAAGRERVGPCRGRRRPLRRLPLRLARCASAAEAEGYLPKAVKTTLKEDKDKKLKIKLRRDPKTLKGKLEIRAFDAKGKPMGAQAKLDDPGRRRASCARRRPWCWSWPPGPFFTLEVSTAGFKTIRQRVEVKGGESTPIRVAMQRGRGVLNVGEEGRGRPSRRRRPWPPSRPRRAAAAAPAEAGPTATLKGKRVQPVGAIEFADGSAKLTRRQRAGGQRGGPAQAERRHQALAGGRPHRQRRRGRRPARPEPPAGPGHQGRPGLPGRRADRISVQGLGPDKPIAPTSSARGRARSRVELDVLEMAP